MLCFSRCILSSLAVVLSSLIVELSHLTIVLSSLIVELSQLTIVLSSLIVELSHLAIVLSSLIVELSHLTIVFPPLTVVFPSSQGISPSQISPTKSRGSAQSIFTESKESDHIHVMRSASPFNGKLGQISRGRNNLLRF